MNLSDFKELAKCLVSSPLCPSIALGNKKYRKMTENEALVIMVSGDELGIKPMASIRGIDIMKGKITLSAQLMLALVKKAGISHEWTRDDNDGAELVLTRAGDKPYRSAFTSQDAKKAGLGGHMYAKFPRPMLRARCLSAAVRAYCPDVLGGVYVEGELDGDIDEPAVATPEARPEEKEQGFTIQKLEAWLKEHKLSTDIIDSWLVSIGGKPTTTMDMSTIGTLVERLNGNEDKLTQLKEYASRIDGESADEDVPF